MKTNLSPNEMAKIESKLRAQNKDWTEAGRNSETESKPAEAEPNPIIPTDQVKTPPPLESRRKPSQKVKG
ncbi:hypothetical protein FACS189460_0940 [Deltaproteobacteria bacterium]|nr:hypothetical protein FACS189460_0940 [Deltaproteobacteria bacterium]